VETVADKRSLTAYRNGTAFELSGSININDLERF